MRPFDGIRIIDTTHVLAGPFATYQLAILGAEVIKIEHPKEPDQTRGQGADAELRATGMATTYLAQSSNKRCVALDLKTPAGREVMTELLRTADVFVENYRPGAFDALQLGYDEIAKINSRLIYCSISAFGQTGPRGPQTAYDLVIQAASGLMAMTGTPEVNPVRIGAPVVDYSTGTAAAFAISSALFQREKTGKGQRIDLSMFDMATILMGAQVTSYSYGGHEPRPMGNRHFTATIASYETRDGLLMIAASNMRQQARLWRALDRPDMIKTDEGERLAKRDEEAAVLTGIFLTRTADEWETYLQSKHVPASRVRRMTEALDDPQLAVRGVLHHYDGCEGVDRSFTVPVAAFQFAHGGPSIETPPRQAGADTDAVLAEAGFRADRVAELRSSGVI
ncbi:CaiB/BaiF CoA transferase family protein [Marinivivus vitaminiproducens]|uniref:CaiB/BaiF CoA transferase family protein n=1 Tax=Marinivivus vitaminiproducens TaxID=3035935 RepID=UPI0027A85EAE|nr:CoA transferase [Geminicoccaceae bacterium SCSIO 64248]